MVHVSLDFGQGVLPYLMNDRMEELEDIRDARTISAAIVAEEETYPHEFVKRLSSDENPVATR
jgi:hypothetical protein